LPLAVGSAMGSACTSAHDRCGQRICVVDGVPRAVYTCAEVTNCAPHLTLTVTGALHDVLIPSGVIGTFVDNEPVLGVRARMLPYVQAVGRQGAETVARAERWPRASSSTAHQRGGSDTTSGEPRRMRRYVFSDLPFALPDLCAQDLVIIAFGTRTVVRLPFFSNAPLDFDVVGAIEMPVFELLRAPQPLEIEIPIQPRGEASMQVVTSVTFQVVSLDETQGRDLASEPAIPPASCSRGHAAPLRCESADVDKEIEALEKQLRVLRGAQEQNTASAEVRLVSPLT